jgi:hypothetical protein
MYWVLYFVDTGQTATTNEPYKRTFLDSTMVFLFLCLPEYVLCGRPAAGGHVCARRYAMARSNDGHLADIQSTTFPGSLTG